MLSSISMPMNNILNKYGDCNKFSLTGSVFKQIIKISEEEYQKVTEGMNLQEKNDFLEKNTEKYKYNITEEEFLKALSKNEKRNKEVKRKMYDDNKELFIGYPQFDDLYDEIKQECSDFDCGENRKYYITDYVGKTTKYGKEHKGFFWNFYHDIAMEIEQQKEKSKYCIQDGKSPIEQIPEELKEHLLYYEVSYYNEVTISSGLMINYYFKLNDETKKYLLKFRNDFCLEPLEDLALYKDDELNFYSCAHENFNSMEIDYKNMTINEIEIFINDNYFNENNHIIIEAINNLSKMPINKKFTFEELNINDSQIIYIICLICNSIKLEIEPVKKQKEKQIFSQIEQLLIERKYDEYELELEKYKNKYQYKEGYYEPLLEEFEEYYNKKTLFQKIQ